MRLRDVFPIVDLEGGMMTKREEIQKGMAQYIKLVGNKPDVYTPEICAEDLMEYLRSDGVVFPEEGEKGAIIGKPRKRPDMVISDD